MPYGTHIDEGAENEWHENGGPSKGPGMNLTDVKLMDQVSRH